MAEQEARLSGKRADGGRSSSIPPACPSASSPDARTAGFSSGSSFTRGAVHVGLSGRPRRTGSPERLLRVLGPPSSLVLCCLRFPRPCTTWRRSARQPQRFSAATRLHCSPSCLRLRARRGQRLTARVTALSLFPSARIANRPAASTPLVRSLGDTSFARPVILAGPLRLRSPRAIRAWTSGSRPLPPS